MPGIRLVSFQPDNATHVAELERQRILCGWGLPYIDFWRGQVRDGDKSLQWLFPAEGEEKDFPFPEVEPMFQTGAAGPPPPDPSFRPLGHVSVDWVDDKEDPSLASKADSVITLATFFILKSQQGKKIGSLAMDEAEAVAKRLGAKTITLNTFPSATYQDPKFWEEKMGLPYLPDKLDLERWYARRGYVPYKTRNMYPYTHKKTGEQHILDLVFMKKDLTA